MNEKYHQNPIHPADLRPTAMRASTGLEIAPNSTATTTAPRRLTDEERRQMCIDAQENPRLKHVQIAGMWSVGAHPYALTVQ